MNKTALATLAALSLFAASSVFATNNDPIVKNGSFEQYSAGWKSVSGDSLEIQKVGNWIKTKYDGDYYLELNANGLGAISQKLKTEEGQSYLLTFGYADRLDNNLWKNQASSIEVWWNTTLLETVTTSSNTWSTYNSALDHITLTGSGKDVLKFVSKGPTANPTYGSFIDGITVTAVPEPASYAMLLAGLGVMGTIARRRSKAAQA